MDTIPEPNFHIEMSVVGLIVLMCVATTFMGWCLTSFIHELFVAKRLRSKPGLVNREMTGAFWLPKKLPGSELHLKIYREATRRLR